jgi:hypothetical protein
VYLTSLRLRASAAGVEALTATPDEIIVMFDRLPALNLETLTRQAGVTLKRGSNQLRFARGSGEGWLQPLYAVVAGLPRSAIVTSPDLPDVMTPALQSA